MDALRCPPPEALVDKLSGGERRRVVRCCLGDVGQESGNKA
jgi:hypothetical protein